MAGRARIIGRRLGLVASLVREGHVSDWPWLVLQVARRLPAPLSNRLTPPLQQRVAEGHHGPGSRFRTIWDEGDVQGLLAAKPKSEAEKRTQAALLGEVALLQPRVSARHAPRPRPGGDTISVHHHLPYALPQVQNGHSLRTQGILSAQVRAGWKVTATTAPGFPATVGDVLGGDHAQVGPVTYRHLIPGTQPADRLARFDQGVKLLVDAVRETKPGILHATTPWTNGEIARVAADQLGLPWVYEMRGFTEHTWVANHATEAARDRAAASERFALIRAKETELALAADCVVTLSQTMRDDLVERGVPNERIAMVPNSVDLALLERPDLTPLEARERLGLRLGPMVIGAVSSVVGYEGLDLIVRVVARLRAEGVDVKGLIVGDGLSRPSLLELVKSLDLQSHVLMPGRVAQKDAPLWVQALDVVLTPRRPDPVAQAVTPLKPVEAMALRRPIVASDLPALRETMTSEGGSPTGLLVPSNDETAWAEAICRLANDAKLRHHLVQLGRDRAEHRTWDDAVSVYEDAYRRCVGSG
jgi:glycosyltransferase involved in cell wall biosynthesis